MSKNQIDERMTRIQLGFECVHEYRQLKFNPKYITRGFDVMFYCIFCTQVTEPTEIDDLKAKEIE